MNTSSACADVDAREFLASDPRLAILESGPGILAGHTSPADLVPVVERLMSRPGARFADLFATADTGLTAHTVIALDADGIYVTVNSPIPGGTMPWLADSVPAAFVEECELFEQFGLDPPEEQLLNRIAVPPDPGGGRSRLPDHALASRATHLPYTVGGHAFEFPVGPVHATGVESVYYGLVTSGEEVVDLFLQTWHKYRGIQRRLPGLEPDRALFLVERSEGLSAASTATAYCCAVEQALGMAVLPQTQRDRAVCVELERLYNHAQSVVALAQSTGLFVGQAHAEIALEKLLRLNAAVAGHRYLFGTVRVGHNRGIDVGRLRSGIRPIVQELRGVIDAILDTNSCVDRLEAAGIVEAEQSEALGLVGPIARACGSTVDLRRDHPEVGTGHPDLAVATEPDGDCLARLLVRRNEIDESGRILEHLADDCLTSSSEERPGNGWGLGAVESPRGETLVWVEVEGGLLKQIRIRTASARNWRGFAEALRSQNVFTDVAIIEASFWLTVAGRVP